jgi:hypothetical protein
MTDEIFRGHEFDDVLCISEGGKQWQFITRIAAINPEYTKRERDTHRVKIFHLAP